MEFNMATKISINRRFILVFNQGNCDNFLLFGHSMSKQKRRILLVQVKIAFGPRIISTEIIMMGTADMRQLSYDIMMVADDLVPN